MLSALLAQRGMTVAAFDRMPDLFPLPRAIGFDHEVMRVMQELGIASRVLTHAAPYRPSQYRGVEGQLIKQLDTEPPPHRLGWAPNYVFDQPAFEREIRGRLSELAGVRVFLSCQVLSHTQSREGVEVEVQNADGEIEQWMARYLVACDGGSSPIRKALGIKLEDLAFDEHWLVVDADVHDHKIADLPTTQVQYCEPERPCTFVVGPGNHRRWEVMLLEVDSLSSDFPPDQLWPLLSRWIKPGDAELRRAAAYRFHGLVAEQWRKGRVLLAGDAAHMTPPFMAQGMVQGIRDAHGLAWRLQRVLSGASTDRLLDDYGVERRPHVTATTRAAIQLGRVICERDPVKARSRDARMLAEQGGVVKTTFRQSMIPPLRDGLIATGTPGAGEPLPQPTVITPGGVSKLLDDITGACFRIVVTERLTDDEAGAVAVMAAALKGCAVFVGPDAKRHAGLGFSVEEETPLLQAWLHGLGADVAIVRPDHYVYGTAAGVEAGLALVDQLRERIKNKNCGDPGSVTTPCEPEREHPPLTLQIQPATTSTP
ncbi:bifunctional 3-(3-hydroxy-phenyl)propionate/3-hydroxycinnamic acid hydroxylase [Ideonella azotifigens]|uniref:Bifunctional 3-(3-hydroxy-phenyl)propionate/3-hydroxycinnamic acid hydroxylase n=1 Tax=Ideonella azotifigens TaxID=513160 RepID=A0ABN1KMW9_9BURK